jgi:hypothetical protein
METGWIEEPLVYRRRGALPWAALAGEPRTAQDHWHEKDETIKHLFLAS